VVAQVAVVLVAPAQVRADRAKAGNLFLAFDNAGFRARVLFCACIL
jgi:hypothetical protein